MADDTIIMEGNFRATRSEVWQPTLGIRWATPKGTTTKPPRLQQMWGEVYTGKTEWRDVPTEVVA